MILSRAFSAWETDETQHSVSEKFRLRALWHSLCHQTAAKLQVRLSVFTFISLVIVWLKIFNATFIFPLSSLRSHAAILKIPNELFYDNELQVFADQWERDTYCNWEHLPRKVWLQKGHFSFCFFSENFWNNNSTGIILIPWRHIRAVVPLSQSLGGGSEVRISEI